MAFESLCVLVNWQKLISALEGLRNCKHDGDAAWFLARIDSFLLACFQMRPWLVMFAVV